MSDPTDEDLFRPTLQDTRPISAPAKKPWRLRSQFVPAFFGGPFAATAIAALNARRIGMPTTKQQVMLAIGIAAGLASATFVALSLPPEWTSEALRTHARSRRLSSRIAGVAAFGIFYWIQGTYDRLYIANSPLPDGQEYESLWLPGVLAVIGGTAVELALALALGLLLR